MDPPNLQIENAENKYSEERLEENKREMVRIMKQAPVAGVYLNQNPDEWQNFFNFYMNFLKSQIGPRGECSKAVRQELAKNPELYDDILKILKMSHKTHIRDIYVKYKNYSPCKQYDELVKVQEARQKCQQSYKRIMDESSIMYNQIKTGMLQKRGPDYDYKAEIQNIREKYKQKLVELGQKVQSLHKFLETNDNYIQYQRLKAQMKPFFVRWRQADMRVGHESVEKGGSFEKIVSDFLLPLLCKRANLDPNLKLKLETNCRWYPKNLGEIDIAILIFDEKQQKWVAKVLIQCKSRLFDVREAFKQVAVLKQKGKQKLATSIGILDLDNDPKYLIVTTLPQNPFHLPIQSKLKQSLQKSSKNIPIDDIKSQELFPQVRQVFKQQMSPLNWFLQNDSDNIIVLKY